MPKVSMPGDHLSTGELLSIDEFLTWDRDIQELRAGLLFLTGGKDGKIEQDGKESVNGAVRQFILI